jgi:alginate O-acetyltransferase complex protein AlgI
MLFNSHIFLFAFLPLTLFGHYWLLARRPTLCVPWLGAASLAFYAWWDWRFAPLLLTSILANYAFGRAIGASMPPRRRHWLTAGIVANLALLGFFKYANFFIGSVNSLAAANLSPLDLLLPLGISFFTFTQIAFLVDTHRGQAEERGFANYLLFVTWFPHLIAGPVLHHRQMMPQFARLAGSGWNGARFEVAIAIFAMGLVKKAVFADTLAPYADPVFSAAAAGQALTLFEAWGGALAYTLQLYFDFSGYSDMAVGLSLMFGVRLPLNFYSPYQATSIIEFWRRWHMTLSRFLRDYLYIPLGGNRHGPLARYGNLLTTMLLGGLWHGAAWTFVAWGGLHGLYLVINHSWCHFAARQPRLAPLFSGRRGHLLTFVAVVVAWVLFRSASFAAAAHMFEAMAGFGAPIGKGGSWLLRLFPHELIKWESALKWLLFCTGLVWFAPSVANIFRLQQPALDVPASGSTTRLAWASNWRQVLTYGLLLTWGLLSIQHLSPFLYFQF